MPPKMLLLQYQLMSLPPYAGPGSLSRAGKRREVARNAIKHKACLDKCSNLTRRPQSATTSLRPCPHGPWRRGDTELRSRSHSSVVLLLSLARYGVRHCQVVPGCPDTYRGAAVSGARTRACTDRSTAGLIVMLRSCRESGALHPHTSPRIGQYGCEGGRGATTRERN